MAVGAWGQNAKADYPNPAVVEMHWRQNPRIFRETFEALFPKAEELSLWSEAFPDWFEKQNGKLYEARTGFSRWSSFHTDDDLGKLEIDGSLKKILKILGSRAFLARVLNEAAIDAVRDASMQPACGTTVAFEPYYKETFFDAYGKGKLSMSISQSLGNQIPSDLYCDSDFTFQKRGKAVVLTGYSAFYRAGDGDNSITNTRWIQRPQALPWGRQSDTGRIENAQCVSGIVQRYLQKRMWKSQDLFGREYQRQKTGSV